MGALVRAELRKFLTTRMWWGIGIGVLLAGALLATFFALVVAGSTDPSGPGAPATSPDLDDVSMVSTVYTGGLGIAYLLTLSVGILVIGSEYRHKTVTSTFLSTPRRVRVMLAKVVALLVIGAGYGLVFLLGSVSVGAALIAAKGFSPFPDAGQISRTLLLSLLVLGLWGLIGLGVGILIPNQVAALLIAVGGAWIVEPLVGFGLSFVSWGESLVRFFPSQATSAMVNQIAQSADARPLEWWAAAIVLALYAAALAGVGSWLTVRRDVT